MKKQGLDDYLLAHGVKALKALKPEQPGASGVVILSRRDHVANAIAFIKSSKAAHVHYYNGDLYEWHESHYVVIPDAVVRARLYKFLKTAKVSTKDGIEPFFPSRRSVGDILDALRGEAELHTAVGIEYDEERTGAFWLDAQEGRPAAEDLLACANGLLDLNTFKLLPHTPALFNTFALPYAYDPSAPKPKHLFKFLRDLWPNDPESISALQEIFGLLLTPDTSHHKIFMIVGPPRSGKGTILRLLTELLGKRNVVTPTLDSFSQNFGREQLINKTLGGVTDARLGSQSNHSRITETMLSISGEDSQSIDRKYRPTWNGRLPIRFLLTVNEIPKFADVSGALASRFITLKHTESFLGNEDHGLDSKLRSEVPSILNWSLDGLRRLRKRGHFVQPRSAYDVVQELSDLASPIKAFLREWCVVEKGRYVPMDQLFACWREWNKVKGSEKYAGSEITFGRNLRAVLPKLKNVQKTVKVDGKSKRVWAYEGLDIIAERVANDKPVKPERKY